MVWAFAAPRTLGQTIFPLSMALNGWYVDPHHLMETIILRGAGGLPERPVWTLEGAVAAIQWWASRLNLLFGWLSDPVVFTNASGTYLPGVHLQYILTVEQIFSRVGSLLRTRDPVAARSLLFGILDSIADRLTGRGRDQTASPKKAAETLEELRANVPREAHAILLTNADRAVGSLDQLARGFWTVQSPSTSQPPAEPQVNIRLADSTDISMPISRAVSTYVGLLRNATHGFGGKQGAKGAKNADALLAHHDGAIPPELSLLAYFYLLDVMCRPDDIKKFVSGSVKRL